MTERVDIRDAFWEGIVYSGLLRTMDEIQEGMDSTLRHVTVESGLVTMKEIVKIQYNSGYRAYRKCRVIQSRYVDPFPVFFLSEKQDLAEKKERLDSQYKKVIKKIKEVRNAR